MADHLAGLGNEVGQVVSDDAPGDSRRPRHLQRLRQHCYMGERRYVTYAGTSRAIGTGQQGDPDRRLSGDDHRRRQRRSTITTSPAPPSGSGLPFQLITMCFRIQRWSLKKDWSVQIEAQTVTASMYDLDVGRSRWTWFLRHACAVLPDTARAGVAPYQVQASSSDALFPGEWTFDRSGIHHARRRQCACEPDPDRQASGQ